MSTEMALTADLRLLAYSAFIVLLMWIPYMVAAMRARGIGRLAGYPTGFYEDLPEWARRAQRAHMNLIENLVPFGALVLVAHVSGAADEVTAIGARLFFWARLVQYVVHVAGIPWLRTLAFVVAWIGNLIILWQILY